jgi:hypothetical protein
MIFERSRRGYNLRLRWTDRALWVWLSLWNDWRSALLMVKPETVIGWHRQGFRRYWRWKSRHGDGLDGRPAIADDGGREFLPAERRGIASNLAGRKAK